MTCGCSVAFFILNARRLFFGYWLFLLIASQSLTAQNLGGRHSFSFVNLPSNAPLAALGGLNVSLKDENSNLFASNPALLNQAMDKHFSMNYIPYYAGIKNSAISYVHSFKNLGRWGAALQYLDYGTFEETDPSGVVLGSFQANDYLCTLGHARTIGYYTLGASLKFAGSSIANYSAFGAMVDIGGNFKHPEHDLSIGLLIKNAGVVLKPYYPQQSLSMPFDVQVGTSYKPKFMPVRFSFTAHHLHQFDITYDDPALNTSIDQNGNKVIEKVGLADKIARHFAVGAQLLLGKAFQLQAGYNHLIHQELKLINRSAGAGFSFGASLHVKAFDIAYARAYHHAVGGTSYITLAGNLGSFLKKKERK
jgi:hypothetical protein